MDLGTIIASVLGIIGTLVAWFFNPAKRRLDELFRIEEELARLGKKRDKALNEKDTDTLSAANADIIGLLSRRNKILQRK